MELHARAPPPLHTTKAAASNAESHLSLSAFTTPTLPVFIRRPEHTCFISRSCGVTTSAQRRLRGPNHYARRVKISDRIAVNPSLDFQGLRLESDVAVPQSRWGVDPEASSASALRENPDDDTQNQFSLEEFDDADNEDDDEDGEEDEDDADDDLEAIELEEQDDDPIIARKSSQLEVFDEDDDDDVNSEDGVTISSIANRRSRTRTNRRKSESPESDLSLNELDIVEGDEGLLALESQDIELQEAIVQKVPKGKRSQVVVDDDDVDDLPEPDMLTEEELEDPTEEELKSAAALLTDSGLLGLSSNVNVDIDMNLEEKGKNGKENIRMKKKQLQIEDEELGLDEVEEEIVVKPKKKRQTKTRASKKRGLNFDSDDAEVNATLPNSDDDMQDTTPSGLDEYADMDEDEEAEFTIMSKTDGSFGKLWELNEDSYITVTEPGQTYAYEMDEIDLGDQEMSSMNRGSKGGWGSGLQNDAKNQYIPGSREWIARRSYDLLTKASNRELKLWTKRGHSPPPDIDDLYDEKPPTLAVLGIAKLTQSMPEPDTESRNVSFKNITMPSKGEAVESEDNEAVESDSGKDSSGATAESDDARSALERAVKFPCSFKFKVEGSGGEALVKSLASDVKYVLGTNLPRSAFVEAPAGRYTRVVFNVEVATAKHVTDLYEAFRQNPLVKFSYG